MDRKKVRILYLLLLIILVPRIVFAGTSPKVYVDEKLVKFDTKVELKDGRTYVPFRKLLESIGAEVTWDNESRIVKANKDNLNVEMQIGNTEIIVNGEKQKIKNPPYIKNGRTLVPLRLISENLGTTVQWNEKEKRIDIFTSNDIKVDGAFIEKYGNKPKVTNIGKKTCIEMTKEDLIKELGKPDRIDKTLEMNSHWYVYGIKDYKDYIRFYLRDGKVVSLITNSKNWNFDGDIQVGDPISKKLDKAVADYKSKGCDLIYLTDKITNTVSSIEITKENERINYRTKNIDHIETIIETTEKHFFDGTNAIRANHGLQILKDNPILKEYATNHSLDMATRDFFEHDAPAPGKTFKGRSDELFATGSTTFLAGENIVFANWLEPSQFLNHLYNSPGHRRNIVKEDFEYLGIGIEYSEKGYYGTQNFGYHIER